LYWSIVSAVVAVSKSRSMGYRGTVTASPTNPGPSCTDASAASVRMPDACRAPASRGLSSTICGGAFRPLCSPVTSSVGSIGRPRCRAKSMLRSTSDSIAHPLTNRVQPSSGTRAHDHGVVDMSLTQPRYLWDQVWLIQPNSALAAVNAAVRGSVPCPASAATLPAPLKTRSSRKPERRCQSTAYATSSAVIRISGGAGTPGGQSAPGVQWTPGTHLTLGSRTSSTCTAR
jgi:hypothetical protein